MALRLALQQLQNQVAASGFQEPLSGGLLRYDQELEIQ
jgi:hypothetical protein